jgi:hypothetical protein
MRTIPMTWRRLAATFVAAALAAPPALAEGVAGPELLFSLDDRGVDLPPVGRSLFDFLVAREVDGKWVLDVPYPFEALIDKLEGQLRPGYREPVKRVLHPLGRSLHRHAAAPHYFRYPRAIAAVDTESDPPAGASGLMLKDRLYLGYQPVTDSIELIAYNEAAARFEYQVVTDYREGGTPQVTYTDRGVCTACHHNQALIYAGQPWAESNANTRIAALLKLEADSFYGIPAQVPFDIPESFDEATDRANFFAAYQRAWKEGCEASGDNAAAVACRRDGLLSALRYRLTGGYQLGEAGDGAYDRFAQAVARGWRARWPAGVALPTANLVDVDPLAESGYGSGRFQPEEGLRRLVALAATDVLQFDERTEPLYERPPLETWRVSAPLAGVGLVEPSWISRVVAGLGNFLAAADIERLDAHLAGNAPPSRVTTFACDVTPGDPGADEVAVGFRCDDTAAAGLLLKGRLRAGAGGVDGFVDRVRSTSAAPGGLALEHATVARDGDTWRARFALRDSVSGLNARLADGSLLSQVALAWPAGPSDGPVAATATFTIADDMVPLVAAVDALAQETLDGRSDALAARPFRRVAVMRPIFADLGIAPMDWCCLDSDHLPPPRLLME